MINNVVDGGGKGVRLGRKKSEVGKAELMVMDVLDWEVRKIGIWRIGEGEGRKDVEEVMEDYGEFCRGGTGGTGGRGGGKIKGGNNEGGRTMDEGDAGEVVEGGEGEEYSITPAEVMEKLKEGEVE